MRYPLLVLHFFMGSIAATAQNWALLNPEYKYNYSNDGTDTISDQIFVTYIDTLGPDSFRYELNKIGVAIDTCGFWTGLCLLTERPQFMGQRCVATADEWSLVTDTATFFIRPLAGIGESWVFDTLNGTTATVYSIILGAALGEPDSLKTIQLSTGDSIVIARDHGVVFYPMSSFGEQPQLVGIEGLDAGILMPSIHELFGLSTGDIIQYHQRIYHYDIGPGQEVTERHYKHFITGRQEFPDSVRLDHTYLSISSHTYNTDPPNIWYDFGGGTWSLPGGPFPFAELAGAHPQKVVRSTAWSVPDQFIAIADLNLDEDGTRVLRTNKFYRENTPWSPNTYPEIYSNPGWAEYREPFGSYGYSFHRQSESCCWWNYTFEVEGAVIDGDTIGEVLPDTAFTVGIDDPAHTVPFDLYYSPENGSLILLTDTKSEGDYQIVDVMGHVLKTGSLTQEPRMTIDVSSLAASVYLLNAITSQGSRTLRFIITR